MSLAKLKINFNKIIILLTVILLYSYSLEEIFFSKFDLTVLAYVIIIFLIIVYIGLTKKIIKFQHSDFIIILLIMYTVFHTFVLTSYSAAFEFIVASISPYFIGRFIYIGDSNYQFFRKLINICAWITILFLFVNYITSNNINRLIIEGLTPVGLAELIGFYAIVNLIDTKGINTSFFALLNGILGLVIMLFFIGSRGAFLSTFIAIFIIYFLNTNKKYKVVLVLGLITIGYLLFFNLENPILQRYPALSRFAYENIINDPSIVGNKSYLGRIGLYLNSLNIISDNSIFGKGLGVIYSHNLFLEIASGLGLIGVSILSLWFISILVLFIQAYSLKINYVLLALFIQSFFYKQTSFSFKAYKSLFIFGGMLVTYLVSIVYNKHAN